MQIGMSQNIAEVIDASEELLGDGSVEKLVAVALEMVPAHFPADVRDILATTLIGNALADIGAKTMAGMGFADAHSATTDLVMGVEIGIYENLGFA